MAKPRFYLNGQVHPGCVAHHERAGSVLNCRGSSTSRPATKTSWRSHGSSPFRPSLVVWLLLLLVPPANLMGPRSTRMRWPMNSAAAAMAPPAMASLTTLSLWPLLPSVAADMIAPAKAPPITAFFCRSDQKHSSIYFLFRCLQNSKIL